MFVRRTLAALAIGAVLAGETATAASAGVPEGMTKAAYRALHIRSEALNNLYGNAVTRLSPAQFAAYRNAGASRLSPDGFNALVVRSEGLNSYGRTLQASTPVAVLIQVTPIVAYAPSAVLWLGRGLRPIVFITGLICLVPLLFGVTTGLRSADLAALDLMAVVDAPGREVLRRIRLPYALPYLFSATRTCVGLALIGAVLAEWYALVDQGLGRRIQEAIDFNQSRQLWASIYAVALLGGLAIVVLNVVERRVLHWHPSARTLG